MKENIRIRDLILYKYKQTRTLVLGESKHENSDKKGQAEGKI